MKNSITASIVFCFKGETHKLSVDLDIDGIMNEGAALPELCSLIAKVNNIDLYSYEYEMMQAESVIYENARGLISNYVIDESLDFSAFEIDWKEQSFLQQLGVIAKQHLSIDNLDEQVDIKQALIEAYRLGLMSE